MSERRVILVLPAREELRNPAMMRISGNDGRIRTRVSGIPARAELDTDFSPVPLGQIGHTARLELSSAAAAPYFAVRATIDDANDVPSTTTDGAAIFSDPQIAAFATPPGCSTAPIGTRADVERRLDVAGLAAKQLDGSGVGIAVMDDGINLAHLAGKGIAAALDASVTWPSLTCPPGQHPVGHGTMCAYGALIAAPKATLLDFPILRSTAIGGNPSAGFLSDALQAYASLIPLVSGRKRRFRSLVVTNSWGLYHESWDFPGGHTGRYVDNPDHPFNVIVGALSRYGVDILFAAGNCGAGCPDPRCQGVVKHTIMGANAHPDVITVAGVTTGGRRAGYSSQGPGIPGMVYAKPDLSSYTHFLGSEACGPGTADDGTSAACPVAAGCVAAIRTRVPPTILGPRDLARELKSDTSSRSAAGWNRNLGYGILEPLRTATRLGL
ncbi:hypothetical protein DK419_02780 [Methylobacterium terrae]|uniref:Peptidase S8/S53 domain-containing protein n=1 Tax=Methylobacterium terrae TaxID=2202827 RepID=A0A2U8WGL8_9HYPH|nr:S8/S53 family peptidase [Methylobacterium terrae]AWN45374.1 hypothetical protein DK419_02780 [Methylobacterium terrae]